jgi:hypothetical protein
MAERPENGTENKVLYDMYSKRIFHGDSNTPNLLFPKKSKSLVVGTNMRKVTYILSWKEYIIALLGYPIISLRLAKSI